MTLCIFKKRRWQERTWFNVATLFNIRLKKLIERERNLFYFTPRRQVGVNFKEVAQDVLIKNEKLVRNIFTCLYTIGEKKVGRFRKEELFVSQYDRSLICSAYNCKNGTSPFLTSKWKHQTICRSYSFDIFYWKVEAGTNKRSRLFTTSSYEKYHESGLIKITDLLCCLIWKCLHRDKMIKLFKDKTIFLHRWDVKFIVRLE